MIKNAIIEDARLGTEDHGFLSIWLTLDYGGSGQGFGGFHLGYLDSPEKNMESGFGNAAGAFIAGCLRAADVTSWKNLIGKPIRVKTDTDEYNSKVVAIGHILNDDCWFNPSEVFRRKAVPK